ncbi:hypothetical protein [Sphingomonas sp.]|uniref:hypothetical protein n=1 Tax=Sphingomonas sp. TaxID=28214 RepID=UPI003BA86A87
MFLSALILATQPQAAPAADASHCIRAAQPVSGTIGTLENRCPDRLVVFMCVTGPPVAARETYFDCAKGQVGSYDVKAHGSAPAIFAGARRVHMFACRFPQFLPRDVRYHHGRGLKGVCR